MRLRALLMGAASGLAVLWSWGGMNEPPVVRDEAAFLLQAEIYARGSWTGPTLRFTEFFEQAHVLVDPVVASKYVPGHSMVLAPGSLVGLPGLMPFLLTVAAGYFLFLLARELTGRTAVGYVSVMIFLAWRTNIYWRGTYFSELTTSAVWLAIWFLCIRWSNSARRSRVLLACIGALCGFAAITRPLTALALTIPLGVFVVMRLAEEGRLRDLTIPVGTGALVLGILPVWTYFTLGSLEVSPLTLYTAQYIPWDRLGFGLDTTLPLRELPPDLTNSLDYLKVIHQDYRLTSLPEAVVARGLAVVLGGGGVFRWILLFLVAAGFWRWWRVSWLVPASITAVFVAYLAYAHAASWSLYYLEVFPLLAVVAGSEVDRMTRALRDQFPRQGYRAFLLVGVIAAVGFVVSSVKAVRELKIEQQHEIQEFQVRVEQLALVGDIGVFVSYPPDYKSGSSFQRVPLEPEDAPVLIAIDRGSDNRKLIAEYPGREWYRLNTEDLSVCRMSPDQPKRAAIPRCGME